MNLNTVRRVAEDSRAIGGDPMTDAEIKGYIQKLIDEWDSGHDSDDLVSAPYLYAKLVAQPRRYGCPNIYAVPRYEVFVRVCKAGFETEEIDEVTHVTI